VRVVPAIPQPSPLSLEYMVGLYTTSQNMRNSHAERTWSGPPCREFCYPRRGRGRGMVCETSSSPLIFRYITLQLSSGELRCASPRLTIDGCPFWREVNVSTMGRWPMISLCDIKGQLSAVNANLPAAIPQRLSSEHDRTRNSARVRCPARARAHLECALTPVGCRTQPRMCTSQTFARCDSPAGPLT